MIIHQNPTDEWKEWFAYRPVRLQDGKLVWLEIVERKWQHKYPSFSFSSESTVIYRRLD